MVYIYQNLQYFLHQKTYTKIIHIFIGVYILYQGDNVYCTEWETMKFHQNISITGIQFINTCMIKIYMYKKKQYSLYVTKFSICIMV